PCKSFFLPLPPGITRQAEQTEVEHRAVRVRFRAMLHSVIQLPAVFEQIVNYGVIAGENAGHRHIQSKRLKKILPKRQGDARSNMLVSIFRLANKQIYEKLALHIIDIDSEYPDMTSALFFENAEKQTRLLVKRLYVVG